MGTFKSENGFCFECDNKATHVFKKCSFYCIGFDWFLNFNFWTFFPAATGLVLRSCANTPQEIQAACSIDARIADICEICYSDGCNGATRYGPAAIMIAIPMIIARVLLSSS